MTDITIYSKGPVSCSVCVPTSSTRQEIEDAVNAENPTGIDRKWHISSDATFKTGEKNPHQCEKDAHRIHYLLNC